MAIIGKFFEGGGTHFWNDRGRRETGDNTPGVFERNDVWCDSCEQWIPKHGWDSHRRVVHKNHK